MMKAIQVLNPGKDSSLEIREIKKPEVSKNEVLVKIEATALNRADLHQRAGKYPPPEGASEILGLEMSGVVERTGSAVSRWSPGERVFALLAGGGYAEYCVCHEAMLMPVPESLSFEEAAAIPETFLTAFQALDWLGAMKQQETVLIHAGGSGVGTSAIQLARHLYDATIITTAGKQHKLDACKEIGANFAYNYKTQNFAEKIKHDLGKSMVNLVIDFVGAPYWDKNIDVLALDGRLVYLSFLGGHKLDGISLGPLLRKRLTVMGSTLRSRPEEYKIELTKAFSDACLDLIEDRTIKPVIDSIFDWEDAGEAHRRMADNKNTGKIVLAGM